MDRVLTQPENVQASSSRTFFSRNEMMLDSADEDASDQDLFVVERKTFKSLCSGLVQQCGCLSNPSWTIASFIKKGHVARVQFVCPHCKQSRVWASSRVLSRHYLANQKLVHAFTCAGMLPRQYMNFYLFAGMGVVKQKNISSVYQNKLYQQVVADVAEESMKAAVERVKESPHRATSGENENCQRMATSHHEYTDVRRPDHHSTYNVLVKKTYRFVQNIWSMYVLRNITSQQILQDDEDDDDDMVLPYDAAMYDGDYVDSEDDDYVCSEDGGDDEEEDN
ncbi:hypothetical protein EMCRGX_G002675 [Ephydatia muelleri]